MASGVWQVVTPRSAVQNNVAKPGATQRIGLLLAQFLRRFKAGLPIQVIDKGQVHRTRYVACYTVYRLVTNQL